MLDAISQTSLNVTKTPTNGITNSDPAGVKTIAAPLTASVYYVGTGSYTPIYPTLYDLAESISQRGATPNLIDIRIVSSITDNRTAVFGASPLGDNKIFFVSPHTGMTGLGLTNNSTDPNSAIISVEGANNFNILGYTYNSFDFTQSFSMIKGGNGTVVKVQNAQQFRFDNVKC